MQSEAHKGYCVNKEYAEANSRKMNTIVVKSVLAVISTKPKIGDPKSSVIKKTTLY